MGSATTQALAAGRAQLAAAKSVDLGAATQLFAVADVVGGSPALLAALTAFDTDSAPKSALVAKLFGSLGSTERTLVEGLVASRWSSPDDLLAAIEELGIRAAAAAEKSPVDQELLAFGRVVGSDHELELAIGSKLSPTEAKLAAVQRLLDGKVSPATSAIVRQLVNQPRGRRIGEMLHYAAEVAADQNGYSLAHVSTATGLSKDPAAATRNHPCSPRWPQGPTHRRRRPDHHWWSEGSDGRRRYRRKHCRPTGRPATQARRIVRHNPRNPP